MTLKDVREVIHADYIRLYVDGEEKSTVDYKYWDKEVDNFEIGSDGLVRVSIKTK